MRELIYLLIFSQDLLRLDLAPIPDGGCQGFIGPIPPPFFISYLNERVQS